MVDLHVLTEQVSKEAYAVSDLFWCLLEAGESRSNYLTPAPGFLYVLKGEGCFTFEGASYDVAPGTVLHGGMNMQLDYTVKDLSEFEYCLVHYRPNPLSRESCMNGHFQLLPGIHPSITELLRSLRTSLETPGTLPSLRTKILFYQLLYETISCCQHRLHKPERADMVVDAIEYIRNHYMNPISLTELAARYNVSGGFFSAQFRKYTSISPIDYLIRYRINRAKELLSANRSSPIREVSRSVGYPDVYYFSRLFKKHTGRSPSQIGLRD